MIRLCIVLSSALVSLGVYGMLTRRNAIGMLLSLELILNAAAVNFVLFGRVHGHAHGQAFALFVIALAACEAVAGLAIVLSLWRRSRTIFVDDLHMLQG